MVKLTSEQAALLENTRSRMEDWEIVKYYEDLSEKTKEEMSLDTLIKALYVGYEIDDAVGFEDEVGGIEMTGRFDGNRVIRLELNGFIFVLYDVEFEVLMNNLRILEKAINRK